MTIHPTLHSSATRPHTGLGRAAALLLGLPLMLAACGDGGGTNQAESPARQSTTATSEAGPETPELANMMAEVQRYSAKLGYAINARNQPLADFYMHEVEETLTRIRDQVPEYEGQRIADNIRLMIEPATNQLSDTIQQNGEWSQIDQQYGSLIDACNTCHTATQRSYIHVTESTGEPPYNQDFTPPGR